MFLPLTALASVFGMNLHHGMDNTLGNFALVCLGGLLLGLAVMAMLGRRA